MYLVVLFMYFHPIYYLRPPYLSLLLVARTQARNHIAGASSPPSPARFVPFLFYREKTSALSSFVDSRRMLTSTINHCKTIRRKDWCWLVIQEHNGQKKVQYLYRSTPPSTFFCQVPLTWAFVLHPQKHFWDKKLYARACATRHVTFFAFS